MLIRYWFANGEVSDVEVSEELGQVLNDFDRVAYNNDHKETRRHVSLDMMVDEQGVQFVHAVGVTQQAALPEVVQLMWDSLLPQQQKLVDLVFRHGYSISEIARMEHVSEAAIRGRLNRIYVKISRSLD